MVARPRLGLRNRARRARRKLLDPRNPLLVRGRLPHPYWRFRFHSFGPHSLLDRPIWLAGAHKMSIGNQCAILPCMLSVEEQAWDRPGPVLVIGDGVAMRPYSTISAAESVILEDDVAIASHSQVFDWWPTLAGPHDQPELNPLRTKPVRIGRGTGLGERVVVLPGSNIGKHCMIGTNSVVDGEIPDHSIATGIPARVVGRTPERRVAGRTPRRTIRRRQRAVR